MRSRYSAYARGEVDYLVDTHAPETRAPTLRADVASWAASARFTRLEVVLVEAAVSASAPVGPPHVLLPSMRRPAATLRSEGPRPAVEEADTVTFVAHFVEGGVARTMSERSRFRRDEAGRWLYVDGTAAPAKPIRATTKVGRNDPCPCGSGKKYKQCCGA